jgi:hypothetical protein
MEDKGRVFTPLSFGGRTLELTPSPSLEKRGGTKKRYVSSLEKGLEWRTKEGVLLPSLLKREAGGELDKRENGRTLFQQLAPGFSG